MLCLPLPPIHLGSTPPLPPPSEVAHSIVLLQHELLPAGCPPAHLLRSVPGLLVSSELQLQRALAQARRLGPQEEASDGIRGSQPVGSLVDPLRRLLRDALQQAAEQSVMEGSTQGQALAAA